MCTDGFNNVPSFCANIDNEGIYAWFYPVSFMSVTGYRCRSQSFLTGVNCSVNKPAGVRPRCSSLHQLTAHAPSFLYHSHHHYLSTHKHFVLSFCVYIIYHNQRRGWHHLLNGQLGHNSNTISVNVVKGRPRAFQLNVFLFDWFKKYSAININ